MMRSIDKVRRSFNSALLALMASIRQRDSWYGTQLGGHLTGRREQASAGIYRQVQASTGYMQASTGKCRHLQEYISTAKQM